MQLCDDVVFGNYDVIVIDPVAIGYVCDSTRVECLRMWILVEL